MGSFKGKGRNQGRDSRRGAKGLRHGFLKVESLEERVLLATAPWQPSSSNLADVKAGPMANAGQDLVNVYQAYLNNGGDAAQVAAKFPTIQFSGGMVGLDVNWNGSGDFNAYVNSLKNIGMQVSTASTVYGVAEGYLPIAQLPTVAADPRTLGLSPVYKPLTGFQGIANNEGDAALKADQARQQFKVNGMNVDGSGVTVGVLSDSVNVAANPGNLPPGSPARCRPATSPPTSTC